MQKNTEAVLQVFVISVTYNVVFIIHLQWRSARRQFTPASRVFWQFFQLQSFSQVCSWQVFMKLWCFMNYGLVVTLQNCKSL